MKVREVLLSDEQSTYFIKQTGRFYSNYDGSICNYGSDELLGSASYIVGQHILPFTIASSCVVFYSLSACGITLEASIPGVIITTQGLVVVTVTPWGVSITTEMYKGK